MDKSRQNNRSILF